MKKLVVFCIVLCSFSMFSQKESKTIFGVISGYEEVLVGVSVTNRSNDTVEFSDTKGHYRIDAKAGDVLNYSMVGKKDRQIIVEDVTKVLNVRLDDKVIFLENVEVTERLKPQERMKNEYFERKGIIKTAYGYLDAAASYGRIVSLDDYDATYACLIDLLKYMLHLDIHGSCATNPVDVINRDTGTNPDAAPILFDVDGQLMLEVPNISISDIRRIAHIQDTRSLLKYGSLGTGGVVAINTEGYNHVENLNNTGDLDLQDIISKRNSLKEINLLDSVPEYLQALRNSESTEEAKAIYEKLKIRYSGFPYFVLDVYEYFYNADEIDFSDAIVQENNRALFDNNPIILKALAYIYQEQGRYKRANEVFKEIFILRPQYAQSYFDLANSYRDLGNPKFAAKLYSRYHHLTEEGLLKPDTTNFDDVVRKEFANLLALEKPVKSENQKLKEALEPTSANMIRVVFEWNDSEAEFNLEFLRGNDEYYIYEHTYDEVPEDIAREKKYGYNTAEYTIDDLTPSNLWQINLNYHGNKSLTPTYFKTTVYKNYGTPQQSEHIHVHKLALKGINQKLLTL